MGRLSVPLRRHRDQHPIESGTTWAQMICALLVFRPWQ
jgi:hypothetical protein